VIGNIKLYKGRVLNEYQYNNVHLFSFIALMFSTTELNHRIKLPNKSLLEIKKKLDM